MPAHLRTLADVGGKQIQRRHAIRPRLSCNLFDQVDRAEPRFSAGLVRRATRRERAHGADSALGHRPALRRQGRRCRHSMGAPV